MRVLSVILLFIIKCNCESNYGPFRTFLYSTWITCNHSKTLNIGVSETTVYFYDFNANINLSYPIDAAVDGFNHDYHFDVTKRLIFFVPGYKSNIAKKTEELIRSTFKEVENSYLMIIDHSAYTSARGGKVDSYERSVSYAYDIGKAIGKFLADLHKTGYPSKNIHAIGHSLGSQMLGYAGGEYFRLTQEKLWRITGLDPAGPCFSNSFIEEQIRSGVAEYVEVYHCNAGGLGTTSVLADIDFFFNKEGKKQLECHVGIIPAVGEPDAAKCSHKACVIYWAKTVRHPGWYLAWKCDNFNDFSKGRCAPNEVTIAGYHNPGNATGVFYVSTDGYNE